MGLICRTCQKPLAKPYEYDWIQVSEHHSWATPDGQSGQMMPYAAVFCSYACIVPMIQELAEHENGGMNR